MIFLYSMWRSVPLSTRQTIAEAFGIKKSLPTHVVNNVVEQDGYQIAEIESKLTPATMAAYLNVPVKTDPAEMWTMLVDKAEGREVHVLGVKGSIPVDEIKKELDAVVFSTPEPLATPASMHAAVSQETDAVMLTPITPTPAKKRGRKPRAS